MCHYSNDKTFQYSSRFQYSAFFFSVFLKKDSNNQSVLLCSDFINKYDSFQMNVDECVLALKRKILQSLKEGFNKLTDGRNNDFGTLPCGSYENEIMMKMELIGMV